MRHIIQSLRAVTVGLLVAGCHRAAAPRAVVDADPLRPLPAELFGAQLPERLADSTYWQMVQTMSEPNGYFRSENFVSNEMGLQHVVSSLQRLTAPGGAYVGVGPEQNFTYIGALKPRIAFIVDIRRQNFLQQLWYKAVFELSPTRAEFLARLFARPALVKAPSSVSADSLIALMAVAPRDPAMFARTFGDVRTQLLTRHGFRLDSSDLATLHYVDSVFYISGPTLNYSSGGGGGFGGGRGGFGGRGRGMPTFAEIAGATDEQGRNRGFLGDESLYGYVRDLERRNLIIPVVGNFAGPKTVRAVGSWLRERNAKVSVYYLSNVEQYLFGDRIWNDFIENVATMPLDSTSRFIRSSSTRGGFGGGAGFGVGNANGFLMTQLTASILDNVQGSRDQSIANYETLVTRRSKP